MSELSPKLQFLVNKLSNLLKKTRLHLNYGPNFIFIKKILNFLGKKTKNNLFPTKKYKKIVTSTSKLIKNYF